jgi:hypothetical protein
MKQLLFTSLLFCLLTTAKAQNTSGEASDNFNKLSWLTGTWNRTNTKPGRSAHEKWERSGTTALIGWGVNLKGQDTVFVEKLKIVVKDNAIYYVADVPENKQPVYFKITAVSSEGFTCENPMHDFPKKIEYKLEGQHLKATISGNGKAIDYLFERK